MSNRRFFQLASGLERRTPRPSAGWPVSSARSSRSNPQIRSTSSLFIRNISTDRPLSPLRSSNDFFSSTSHIASSHSSSYSSTESTQYPSQGASGRFTLPHKLGIALFVPFMENNKIDLPFLRDDLLTNPSPPISTISQFIIDSPLPSYGLTIVAVGLLLRLTLFVPLRMWQRNRERKMVEVVAPQFKLLRNELARNTLKEMIQKDPAERTRTQAGYERFQKALEKKFKTESRALLWKYGTHPIITTLGPALIHIPLFILFSLSIRSAIAQPPHEIANSGFWFIQHLGEPSKDLALVGMLAALANSELVRVKNERYVDDMAEDAKKAKANLEAEQKSFDQFKEKRRLERLAESRDQPINPKSARLQSTPPSPSSAPLPPTSSVKTKPTAFPSSPMEPVERKVEARPSPVPHSSERLSIPKRHLSTTAVPLRQTQDIKSTAPVASSTSTSTSSKIAQSDFESVEISQEELLRPVASIITTKAIPLAMKVMAWFIYVIGNYTSSGVVLYWVTSTVFSIFQNIYLMYFEKKIVPKH